MKTAVGGSFFLGLNLCHILMNQSAQEEKKNRRKVQKRMMILADAKMVAVCGLLQFTWTI